MRTTLGVLAFLAVVTSACSSGPSVTASKAPPPSSPTSSRASSPPATGTARVRLEPAGNFRAGEMVTLVVRGFPAGQKVFFSECLSRHAAGPEGCGEQLAGQPFTITDAQGNGQSRFKLTPKAPGASLSGRTFACRGTCVLVATGGYDGPYAVTRLHFAT